MAEVTEADREKARELRQEIHRTAGWPNQDALIAVALVEEREKARDEVIATMAHLMDVCGVGKTVRRKLTAALSELNKPAIKESA